MTYTSVLALVILRLNAILEKIGNAEEIRIPMDLVVLILSHLSLKDNIRASSVCKAWHKAAVSVRRNSPWLVYFDHDYLTGFSFGFYDPTEKIKTRSILLPNQPLYASLCCSKDGWLLLIVNYQEDDPASLVFFNPFTRVYIILPRLIAIENFRADYAFSCAPTNESCVVCCIIDRTEDSFLIHTWDFGAVEWMV
ncbi:unnamed protein product [Thlaspi arvense]|uniref:F-box domain-containing protein n=1 Tax=Thlaspi arvense TaxID=13288 RepID=A0AAU9SR29_THLAR|nr:unnamed protein product [Thlaspi arvense]